MKQTNEKKKYISSLLACPDGMRLWTSPVLKIILGSTEVPSSQPHFDGDQGHQLDLHRSPLVLLCLVAPAAAWNQTQVREVLMDDGGSSACLLRGAPCGAIPHLPTRVRATLHVPRTCSHPTKDNIPKAIVFLHLIHRGAFPMVFCSAL